jgi:ABC-2 type transport system ATP-binding protein
LEEAESLCRHIAIMNKGEVIENTDMKGLLDRADEEMFVLSLEKPVEVVPIIDGCTFSVVDDTTWQVSVQRQVGIHALIVGLDRLGVKVSGLRNQSNRLEQLFIKLMAGKKES